MPVDNANKRAYTGVQDKIELFIHILKKEWDLALKRIEDAPEEASIMVERRDISGAIVLRHMPIHQAFAGDVPKEVYGERHEMPDEKLQVIKALLRLNSRVVLQKDLKERTLLHLALASQVPPPVAVINALIKANPHSVKARDSEGRLPLHSAVASPITTFENVNAVFNAYPGAIEISDEDDSLPIHLAAWGGDVHDALPVIKLFVTANPNTLTMKDGDDETVLNLMTKYGRTSSEALRFVVEQDPKALYRDRDERDGNTPLHFAVSAAHRGNDKVYVPILEYDPKAAEKINRIGKLPLHVALERCCVPLSLVQDLIEAFPQGATLRDGEGYTPLHHVANVGVSDMEIVKLLIKRAPKSLKHRATMKKGEEGPLPFHLAMRSEADRDMMNKIISLFLKEYPEAALTLDPGTSLQPLATALMMNRSPKILKKLMMLNPDAVSQSFEITDDSLPLKTWALHLLTSVGPTYLNGDELTAIAKDLLVMDPDGVKRKDGKGRSPLHIVWKDALDDPEMQKSRQSLFNVLLSAYPDSAKLLDDEGRPPVAYASAARDDVAVNALLDLYPEAAEIKSTEGLYPLHYACGNGKEQVDSDRIERTVKRLLNEYPQAAAHPDDQGELPLHKLCESAGPDGILPSTISMLLDAYPEAVQQRDGHGLLPLLISVNNAVQSDDPDETEYWMGLITTLLERYPDAASVKDKRGRTTLTSGIQAMETLSHARREEDDHVLQIFQMLYDLNPQSVLESAGAKRNGLHSIAQLLGDLGGMLPTSWSDFAIRIMQDYPDLLVSADKDGRTPLHMYILYLGDTAIGARENQDPNTQKHTNEIEQVLHTMLALNPSAMTVRETYGLTPLDLINHKRLSLAKGSAAYEQSPIVKAVKRLLQRGEDYWEMAGDIERAKIATRFLKLNEESADPCAEIQAILLPVQQRMQGRLESSGIEPDDSQLDSSCVASPEGQCQMCPEQYLLLDRLSADLGRLATSFDSDMVEELTS